MVELKDNHEQEMDDGGTHESGDDTSQQEPVAEAFTKAELRVGPLVACGD